MNFTFYYVRTFSTSTYHHHLLFVCFIFFLNRAMAKFNAHLNKAISLLQIKKTTQTLMSTFYIVLHSNKKTICMEK